MGLDSANNIHKGSVDFPCIIMADIMADRDR
jgi:hypothetical protein